VLREVSIDDLNADEGKAMSTETTMAIEQSTQMPQRSESGASVRYETKVFSYTGLRVSDAVSLTTDRIAGNKIFLYTAKTGVPVFTILPGSVLRILEETPRMTDTRFFTTGQCKPQSAIGEWQMRIKDVFELAGIAKGLSHARAHRLRDTFATELLLAGVPIERVSMLLGHQSIAITEKHYSPWTRSRQEQIEADLTAAWRRDLSLKTFASGPTKGTRKVHEKNASVN
jgi:integrase/recombinase XerD